MYAPGRTFAGAGDNISCPRQVGPDHRATQETLIQVKLRGAGVVRYSLVNPRPSRTPQGYVGVAG